MKKNIIPIALLFMFAISNSKVKKIAETVLADKFTSNQFSYDIKKQTTLDVAFHARGE